MKYEFHIPLGPIILIGGIILFGTSMLALVATPLQYSIVDFKFVSKYTATN
jgi:hypothetical protein